MPVVVSNRSIGDSGCVRGRGTLISRALAAAGRVIGALVACGVAGGCGAEAPPRNVVLVSIDTLRADMLGCYGYARPTSPSLDALAGEGVLFEQVVATSPWTLPSHGSLLTGLYPSRHGLRSPWKLLPGEVGTWAEVLSEAGFESAAIVSSFYLGRRFGLARGFETLIQLERPPDRAQPSAVTNLALRWLDQRHSQRRFFLFLHYYDAHSDYATLPRSRRRFETGRASKVQGTTAELLAFRRGELTLSPADVDQLRNRYAAEIFQVDEEIGRLRAGLAERGLDRETLFIVISDHGEEFLDHGGVMHGATHFEEMLRVPWILSGPGIPVGRRVGESVSLVDVMPTALSVLGVARPTGLDGMDVSPWIRGEEAPILHDRRLFAETAFGADWNESLASVREGQYKLVAGASSGRHVLYDLVADPGEERNAAERLPEVSARLRKALRDRPGGARPGSRSDSIELSPDEQEQLRALGYAP